MKYKFCSIRINVTKGDVTFATKGGFNSQPPWLRHWFTSTSRTDTCRNSHN